MSSTDLWPLLLLVACTGEAPKTTPDGPSPTDPTTTDTDTDTDPTTTDTGPSTTDRPTTEPPTHDPCDDPLVASIPQPGVLARQDLRVDVEGGSGELVFSLSTNASGGSINAVSGNYLAGPTPGVTDVVQVDDTVCGTSTTVDILVFLPLEVLPTEATVAPFTSFEVQVSEGSGTFHCEDGLLQSGGGFDPGTCVYTAGDTLGVDQLFVVDDLTAERVELTYTLSDDLDFAPWAATWLLPQGVPYVPQLVGGSGSVDIVPPAGLDWDGSALTGVDVGTYTVALTDRFTGQVSSADVVVAAALGMADPVRDGERLDWFDSAWGDLDGDGFDDLVVATPDGGAEAFLGGGVYVYLGSATGLVTPPVQVFGHDEPYGYGGRSVALGDIDQDGLLDLAWGAPGARVDGSNNLGLVRVHRGLGDGTFEPDATWERWGEYAGDQLGYQVALCDVSGDGADDLVAVAWRGEDRTAAEVAFDTGDVRIYTGNPGGPTLDPAWRAYPWFPDGSDWIQRNAGWGLRMATGDLDGDGACDLLLANYQEGLTDNTDTGVIWRYLATDLTAAEPRPSRLYTSSTDSQFGRALSIGDVDGDGLDDVLVGARVDDTAFTNAGAGYLFLAAADDGRPATEALTDLDASWSVHAQANYDYVGWGVALADLDGDGLDDVAIGASSAELAGDNANTGVVGWFDATQVLATSTSVLDEAVERWAPVETGELFGTDLGVAGDLDGDGLLDLVAPASRGRATGADTPRIYPLHQGQPEPVPVDLPAEASGTLLGDRGTASFLDLDGDGVLDVLGGAWSVGEETLGFNVGTVVGFLGDGTTWETASFHPFVLDEGIGANDRMGYAVASAGDFDGDGWDDAVAISWNDAQPGTVPVGHVDPDGCATGSNRNGVGSAWIHRGGPGGIDPVPSYVVFGYDDYDHIDRSTAADLDGDGLDDLVLGLPSLGSNGGFGIVRGRAPDPGGVRWICDTEWTEGVSSGSRLGTSVATVGDLDGDGCAEVALGSELDDLGRNNQGALRILWGDGVGCSGPATTTVVADQNGVRFGDALDAGLDADGDSVPDVVVGAWAYDDGATDIGGAWIVSGAWLAGLATDAAPGWTLPADGSTTVHIVDDTVKVVGAEAYDEVGHGVALVRHPADPTRALMAVGVRYGDGDAGGVTLWDVDGGVRSDTPWAIVVGPTPYSRLGDHIAGHPDASVVLVGAPFGDGEWLDQGVVYPFLLP